VVTDLAKVTLSVPDDLYEKLEKHKDRLNYSDIFRRAVSEEIEKVEEKGELIKELINHLNKKLSKTDDKQNVRKEEIDRFTKKWGTPDAKGNTEVESPYVTLERTEKVNIGDQAVELEISNRRDLAAILRDQVQRGFGKYEVSLHYSYLEPLVEYFRSKDFTIEEHELIQAEVMNYVLKMYGSEGKERQRELASKGHHYFGLFAADKEDYISIAYREVVAL
jgi:predicted CopG family antitoxin